MPETQAQMLVEETEQRIQVQKAVVADLERKDLDATLARKHLAMLEETLARRTEIRDQIRSKPKKKP
jgi:DNA helicase TIP49 (TBP-interacting protein)